MHWFSRVALSLVIGSIVAAAAQTLQSAFGSPHIWISISIGIAATAYSFFKALLDASKIILEIRKLRYEVDNLQRAEKEIENLVRPATPEERSRYVSSVERRLNVHWTVEQERDRLSAQAFIEQECDEKGKNE
jgi:uncharacterized membrane protein YhiD involved in acid resistance